jgi:hypothetical protein
MSTLNAEQMNKLSTPRLIAYQKKQRSFLGKYFCGCCGEFDPDFEEEYDELCKHTGSIKYMLLQREDYKSTKVEGQERKTKHDRRAKNKGCQSLNGNKKRKKNR